MAQSLSGLTQCVRFWQAGGCGKIIHGAIARVSSRDGGEGGRKRRRRREEFDSSTHLSDPYRIQSNASEIGRETMRNATRCCETRHCEILVSGLSWRNEVTAANGSCSCSLDAFAGSRERFLVGRAKGTKDSRIERHTNSKCSWRERVSLSLLFPRHDIDLFICPSCTVHRKVRDQLKFQRRVGPYISMRDERCLSSDRSVAPVSLVQVKGRVRGE